MGGGGGGVASHPSCTNKETDTQRLGDWPKEQDLTPVLWLQTPTLNHPTLSSLLVCLGDVSDRLGLCTSHFSESWQQSHEQGTSINPI